ncbi:hypothetical protein QBC32DRAFT_404126 [Pseudoneurospora amorphoporcata]|uniref:SAP domain-containing protein n=1 Tax=Pseudoneurospora amorphoporcata TaxID=241081 RepID=A0AAN6NYY2_9PEZI|nr:hypothetical protein QBC32DRAFT_404126 [Pseudoneurospora amorphoporcata]
MTTDWSKLTVVDLRQELKRRGRSQAGKKADLVERLTVDDQEAQTSQQEGDAPQEAEQEEDQEQGQEAEATSASAPEDEATKSSGSPPPASVKAPSQEPQPEAASASPAPEPVAQEEKSATAQDAAQTESNIKQEGSNEPTKESAAESAREANNVPVTKDDTAEAKEKKAEKSVSTESAPVAPELTSDTSSRKRRSRSPPPEEETSRKRARPTDQKDEDARMSGLKSQSGETVLPLDDEQGGQDASYATIHPEIPQVADSKEVSEMPDAPQHREASELRDSNYRNQEEESRDHVKTEAYLKQASPDRAAYDRSAVKYEADMDIDERDVAPSEHPATQALYIKNLMRPLRPDFLRRYLEELAAPPGSLRDLDSIRDFHLDHIKTHAFVSFTSVAAAARVRVALHGQIWPNERNRKELWVDFIPPDRVNEWAETEQSEGGRGNLARWEVRYERDEENGDITTRLVNAELEPAPAVVATAGSTTRGSVSSAREPLPPPVIPSGPAAGRQHPSIEGAPSGPRGRGGRVPQPALTGDEMKATRTHPSLLYRPVNAELAERRLSNMRSFYTRDRHRDMGREDEINRYTFEDADSFVDRGKEVFVGIRPPHREAERRRGRVGGGGGGGEGGRGGPPPPPFGRLRGGDRYLPGGDRGGAGGGRDEPPPRRGGGGGGGDEPRSRFDGAPLPTFEGGPPRRRRRGHGGGGGGGGGGGYRGDRY